MNNEELTHLCEAAKRALKLSDEERLSTYLPIIMSATQQWTMPSRI
jgi:hypothetical protein